MTAVMVIVAAGAAAVFSNADQAARIAADSQRLKSVQIALADTATHRAALVIAFASANSESTSVSIEALNEAVATSHRINQQLATLEDGQSLQALANEVAASTKSVHELLTRSAPDAARVEVEADTLPALVALADALSREAARVSGLIDAEQAQAGRLSQAASFVVALLVPVLSVTFIRRRSRRRLERSQLESELNRQREIADAKDRLIAGLSHQLRTPLTGIYGWADLISHQPGPQIVDEGAVAILSQSGELRRMVDDILVTARLDATNLQYRPEAHPVTAIVEGAISHFVRVGEQVKVDCHEATVLVDRPRLQHVIHNLVANAFAHGNEPVEVIGREDGGWYRLAICDTGPGLGSERAKHPFAAFDQAPEDIVIAPGLGLGLSVARALVSLMGGEIEYRHQVGHTVFMVSIPMAAAA
ncbi:MAG TPA: HAMP domain-containing sensor histidine kinase [Acidimicrobiia bacterium]|nr:HAMP domain-containing sensor histidine kinase [Acidimicrobiia bacterium]